jgi:hypothetical protein
VAEKLAMAILLKSAMSVKNRLAATIPNDLIGIAKTDSVSVKTLFYKTESSETFRCANVSPKDTACSLVFPIPFCLIFLRQEFGELLVSCSDKANSIALFSN